MPSLYDVYVDRSLENYTPLEDFVSQVEAGEFGAYSREERIAFLREVEAHMMGNIELQIAARPELADRRDGVAGDVHARIQDLIDGLKD